MMSLLFTHNVWCVCSMLAICCHLSLQLAYLSDQKVLLDHFESSNVPDTFGGSLKYDHKNWVYNRLVSKHLATQSTTKLQSCNHY